MDLLGRQEGGKVDTHAIDLVGGLDGLSQGGTEPKVSDIATLTSGGYLHSIVRQVSVIGKGIQSRTRTSLVPRARGDKRVAA